MIHKWFPMAFLAGLLALAVACGDDEEKGQSPTPSPAAAEGDAAEVEAAIMSLHDAWNAADGETFLSLVTDNFIEQVVGGTRAEFEENLDGALGDPQLTVTGISDIQVSGDTATAQVDSEERTVLVKELTLVRENGVWKIDGEEELLVPIPAGVKQVNVQLNEFAFGFLDRDITDGNFAFAVDNVGAQDHEFTLFRVNEEFDPEAIAASFSQPPAEVSEEPPPPAAEEGPAAEESGEGSEDLPPGIEQFISHHNFLPGEAKNIVFNEALEPGEYALVCCYPDTDDAVGTPHCGKGMIREFTVP